MSSNLKIKHYKQTYIFYRLINSDKELAAWDFGTIQNALWKKTKLNTNVHRSLHTHISFSNCEIIMFCLFRKTTENITEKMQIPKGIIFLNARNSPYSTHNGWEWNLINKDLRSNWNVTNTCLHMQPSMMKFGVRKHTIKIYEKSSKTDIMIKIHVFQIWRRSICQLKKTNTDLHGRIGHESPRTTAPKSHLQWT